MTGTTTTTTTALTSTGEFAAAVRAALSDLPPDELDELTDGLEADLAERASETDAELGDPAAYAEELRAAAGYPPRSARTHLGDTLPNLRTLPQELRRRWDAQRARHAWLRAVVDFFVALRPVWWVFRGLAIYAIVAGVLGFNAISWWPIAAGAAVLSVQLGRGRMLGRAWVLWLLRASSIVAIIAAPPLIQGGLDRWTNAAYYEMQDQTYYPQGLSNNGSQIDNIFAYDAEGKPIDQVQLFDQNGEPLNLSADTTVSWWDAQDGSMLVPNDEVPGRAGWNVYPLAHVNSWSDYEDDGTIDDSETSPTEFPLYTVKPLAGHELDSTPTTDVEGTPPAG